jgi:biotin carboxyl carrier protein
MIHTYQQGDGLHTVRLEAQPDGSLRAVIADRTYRVRVVDRGGGVWQVTLDDGPRQTFHTAAAGSERFVQFGVDVYRAQLVTAGARRRAKPGGAHHLVAQMPAQVAEVLVSAGDTVTVGQTLLLLEAMKMEMRVTAPHDGEVTQVFVNRGDVVERDQQLIDIRDLSSI